MYKKLKTIFQGCLKLALLPIFVQVSHAENTFAQLTIDNVDYDRIPQKKVIQFVETQKKKGGRFFSEFVPKCFNPQDSSSYHKISSSYIIKGNADDLWKEYMNIQPGQAYSGKMVGFGFLYSKDDDRIIYNHDPFDCMKVGQLFFFNISLLGGLRNLGIADEVTAIDENLKTIRFCYIQNGKTEGTQEIRLRNIGSGLTQVVHDTWYKSKSRFRDNVLYPYFHKRTINEFHQIVRMRFEHDSDLRQTTNLK